MKEKTLHVDLGRGPVGYLDAASSIGRLGVFLCSTCGAAVVTWDGAANHNAWHNKEADKK